jgi:hypothetical protein
LLIAVVGDTYGAVKDEESEEEFWTCWLEFVTEVVVLKRTLKRNITGQSTANNDGQPSTNTDMQLAENTSGQHNGNMMGQPIENLVEH